MNLSKKIQRAFLFGIYRMHLGMYDFSISKTFKLFGIVIFKNILFFILYKFLFVSVKEIKHLHSLH